MNQITTFLYSAILAAGLLPAVGAGLLGEWGLVGLFVVWTAVWFGLLWHKADKKPVTYIPSNYADYLLLLAGLLLAYGVWLDVAAAWLLGGIAATLAAWDLDAFRGHLHQINRIEQSDQLVRTHLHRLLVTLSLGLTLAALVLLIQFELRFGWGLLLVLLIIISFGQVIRFLRTIDPPEG